MASSYTLSQPRSPATMISGGSNSAIMRSHISERVPVRWRAGLCSRSKHQVQDNSSDVKETFPSTDQAFLRNEEKRVPEMGKPRMLHKLYVDQQTGEMRLSTTDQSIGNELLGEGDTNHIRRYIPNRRLRSRTQSDETTSPRTSRCVWNQSLKTKSIAINSRVSPSSSESLRYLWGTPGPQRKRLDNVLPRISRSAENIAVGSSFEIPARYPRGQQRPTGLASGHHALLLRHRELVEASRRTRVPCRQLGKRETLGVADEMRNNRYDFNTRYLNKAYPSLLRVPEQFFNGNTASQKRCGQEVTSVMKANRKCLEWFNTWVDD